MAICVTVHPWIFCHGAPATTKLERNVQGKNAGGNDLCLNPAALNQCVSGNRERIHHAAHCGIASRPLVLGCSMLDATSAGFQHVDIPGARLSRTARYRRVAADLQWDRAHVAMKPLLRAAV